jgi:ankyrin repeat protein
MTKMHAVLALTFAVLIQPALGTEAKGSVAVETREHQTPRGINVADKNGVTPLMRACARGSVSEVKRLIASGANVNAADKSGGTPLLHALAHVPSHPIVKLLLDAGADPSKRSSEGFSPLCIEISEDNGDMKSIEMLIDNEADQAKAATYALYCLQGFHSNIYGPSKAEFLLKRGADANDRIPSGNIPFIVDFAAYGDSRVLSVLIQKGHADVNATSSTGETALMAAARTKHAGSVKVLLDMGADCNRRNHDGLRALDLARVKEPNQKWNEEHRIETVNLLSGCSTSK